MPHSTDRATGDPDNGEFADAVALFKCRFASADHKLRRNVTVGRMFGAKGERLTEVPNPLAAYIGAFVIDKVLIVFAARSGQSALRAAGDGFRNTIKQCTVRPGQAREDAIQIRGAS